MVSDAPVHEQEGPVSSNLIDVDVFFKSCNPYESLVVVQITVMLQSILFFIHVFFLSICFQETLAEEVVCPSTLPVAIEHVVNMHTLPSEFFLNSVVIWIAIHILTDFFLN